MLASEISCRIRYMIITKFSDLSDRMSNQIVHRCHTRYTDADEFHTSMSVFKDIMNDVREKYWRHLVLQIAYVMQYHQYFRISWFMCPYEDN